MRAKTPTQLNKQNVERGIKTIKSSTPSRLLSQIETSSEKHELIPEDLIRKFSPKNTEQQIVNLLNIKYMGGGFIINNEDKEIIIEIIDMIKKYDIDNVFLFLQKCKNKNDVIWNQKSMDIGKVSIEREIYINQAEEMGVKGVGKCRYCIGTELVFNQKQVNSGDEPMKVYVRCVSCGQSWRQG